VVDTRILAVDPGEKRIGIAISDLTRTIANPLLVLSHISRLIDAGQIAALAGEHEAGLIIIGATTDEDGQLTPQGRSASRLAAAIRAQTHLPVELWDESGSTQAARQASIALGVSAYKRRRQGHGHLDELAATYILQTYLDSLPSRSKEAT
jgi:putative Holliday junction resolvase